MGEGLAVAQRFHDELRSIGEIANNGTGSRTRQSGGRRTGRAAKNGKLLPKNRLASQRGRESAQSRASMASHEQQLRKVL